MKCCFDISRGRRKGIDIRNFTRKIQRTAISMTPVSGSAHNILPARHVLWRTSTLFLRPKNIPKSLLEIFKRLGDHLACAIQPRLAILFGPVSCTLALWNRSENHEAFPKSLFARTEINSMDLHNIGQVWPIANCLDGCILRVVPIMIYCIGYHQTVISTAHKNAARTAEASSSWLLMAPNSGSRRQFTCI